MADETEHGALWGGPLERVLQDMAREAILMLAEVRPEAGDVAAIEKRLRAIGVAARSLKAVQSLSQAKPQDQEQAEEAMGGQFDDGLDAEDIDVLRARLQARIDDIRAAVEWKRDGRPEPGPGARGSEMDQVAA